jgi:hypothetical protein
VRFPAIAAGAIAAVAALSPATAGAAPTNVIPSLPIYVIGVADTDNDVTVTYQLVPGPPTASWSHFVTDEAGVVAKPGDEYSCIQRGANTAECPDTTSFELFDPSTGGQGESFEVQLRGGNDSLVFNSPDSPDAYGGAGNDILIGNSTPAPEVGHLGDALYGGKGKDVVGGRAGPDFISGGKGRDRLTGGEGNDNLNAKDGARDKRINCGPGRRDQALIDKKIDPAPRGCEVVKRV